MSGRPEILFVDPAVSDIPTILLGVRPEVEAILLDAKTPVAPQMAAALDGRQNLDAVHVIAHGAPGLVSFAAGEWSMETLRRDAADLAAIGRALGEGGNLRLWSCETGKAKAGAVFTAGLERGAQAHVAAATRKVGAVALGGAWALALCANIAKAGPPLTSAGTAGYPGVLAPEITISGTIASGTTTRNITYFVLDRSRNAVVGNITLPDASTFANAFRLSVSVPQLSESFDVGLFNEAGAFASAGFQIEAPTGAVGARG